MNIQQMNDAEKFNDTTLSRYQSEITMQLAPSDQIISQSFNLRHTRLILITLPLLLNDNILAQLKQTCQVQQIDSLLLPRKIEAQKQSRIISMIHILSKLPHYITHQQKLQIYLQESLYKLQDPLNLVFVFYGISTLGERFSIQQLESSQFVQDNPKSSSISVQFTTSKPKDRALSVLRQKIKCQTYFDEMINKFPDRTFKFDIQDNIVNEIQQLFLKFQIYGINNSISYHKQDDIKLDLTDNNTNQNYSQINLVDFNKIVRINLQKPTLKLIIIYSLLTPCCGKSMMIKSLINIVQKLNKFDHIISVETSANIIQESSAQTLQDAESISQQLLQSLKMQIPCQNTFVNQIIYLDRNCPPNTFLSTNQLIKVIQSKLEFICTVRVKNLGVFLPESSNTQQPDQINLSYAQIVTLLKRVFYHAGQEALLQDLVFQAKVMMKYISLYRNVKNNQKTLKKFNLHKSVELNQFIDLTNINKKRYQRLIIYIDECINQSRITRDLGDGECFGQLVSEIYKLYPNMRETTIEEIMQQILINAQKIEQSAQELFNEFS